MLKHLIEKYRRDRADPKLDENMVSNMQKIKESYDENKSEKNKKSIIDLLEEDRKDERYDVWRCVFEDDLDMYENVILIETKKLAEKSMRNYQGCKNDDRPILLTLVADLCLAKYNSAKELESVVPELSGISEKIVDIFVDVFKSEPCFRSIFEKEKNDRAERMARYYQEALENAKNTD